MLATLVSAIAALSLPVAPPASAAFDGGTDLFVSAERSISDNVGSPSDCTPSQIAADATARTDVDAQNDPWIATAASRGLGLVLPAVIDHYRRAMHRNVEARPARPTLAEE